MKLISLYIENFGGLSRFSLQFEEGLTVINQPNGFGKTTLAEFIRAMFYGFPRKAKTLDKSRRQKYTPWNGGKYGGHLTFEAEGKQFRIERTFGATPKGDTFTLIDLTDNKKSSRFSEEIGLELFGLDSDSFERSTYMPQLHDSASLTTNTIQAKLSNLVEDTNDINNYDKAMEALRARRSTFVPYRGSGGSVAHAQSRISALQTELDHCQNQESVLINCAETVSQWEAQLKRDQEVLAATRQEIVTASAAAASKAAKQQYGQMESQYRRLQIREDELSHYMMEPQLLEDLAEKNWELVKKQHELEMLASGEEDAKLFELELLFADGAPSEEELASGRQHLARIQSLRQEKLLLSASKPEEPPRKKQSSVPAIALLILGIGAIAAGIVLLVQKLFWPGGILLGAGIAALVGAIFLFVHLMVTKELTNSRQNRPEQLRISMIDQEIAVLEQLVRELVRPFTGKLSLSDALEYLHRSAGQYQELRMNQAARREKQTQLTAEIAQLQADIRSHLGDDEPEHALLQRRLAREQHREITERMHILEHEMASFRLSHEAELSAPDEQPAMDLSTLQQRERQLTLRITYLSEQILAKRQQMHKLQEELDRIPGLQEELSQWQIRKAEDQKKARLLDETMEFLQKAKENLQSSYLGPIRARFDEYMSRLMAEKSEQILLSPELDVHLERYGQSRELGYFSAGQTDAVMLCMRLALVDALFGDVKPFVILDDPFVNLDDRRTSEALALLKELAQEKQIVYLICHSSRSL